MATLGLRGLALLALYAGFGILSALPNQVASLRAFGPSLLWWYGGVLAPIAAVLIAAASSAGRRSLPGP